MPREGLHLVLEESTLIRRHHLVLQSGRPLTYDGPCACFTVQMRQWLSAHYADCTLGSGTHQLLD